MRKCWLLLNGTTRNRHQWKKTAVLSYHRFLISYGVEKWTTFKYGFELDHQMSLNKSKCWYSNNCLHFLKRTVPLQEVGLAK
jgi:hypothetical protein